MTRAAPRGYKRLTLALDLGLSRRGLEGRAGGSGTAPRDTITGHGVSMEAPNRLIQPIQHFILKEGGLFFLLTKDAGFLSVFTRAVASSLALPRTCCRIHLSAEETMKAVGQIAARERKIVLLVEREIEGISNILLVKHIKLFFPSVKIILLTPEIQEDLLILLHELGTDSVITKPIGERALLEKLANVIRPLGKLGELLETGKGHLMRGNTSMAMTLGEEALRQKPDSPAALMLMGDALRAMERHEDALAAYSEAHHSAEMYLEPVKRLIQTYRDLGDSVKELEYLERLDRLSPLNVERKVQMGGLKLRLGKLNDADREFGKAVKLTTDQAMSLIGGLSRNIAEQCMAHAPDLAERYLRYSLEAKQKILSRADMETFNALGLVLRMQGKWREAVVEYRKALEIAPDDEIIRYNLALAYMDGQEYGQAAEEIERALAANGEFGQDSDTVCYNIGHIFSRAGNQPMAVFYFTQALKLNPNHEEAGRMVEKLAEEGYVGTPAEPEGCIEPDEPGQI